MRTWKNARSSADDLQFRQAMSVAINREEINEVAFFGMGEAKQYVGFSPAPDFLTKDGSSTTPSMIRQLGNKLLAMKWV